MVENCNTSNTSYVNLIPSSLWNGMGWGCSSWRAAEVLGNGSLEGWVRWVRRRAVRAGRAADSSPLWRPEGVPSQSSNIRVLLACDGDRGVDCAATTGLHTGTGSDVSVAPDCSSLNESSVGMSVSNIVNWNQTSSQYSNNLAYRPTPKRT